MQHRGLRPWEARIIGVTTQGFCRFLTNSGAATSLVERRAEKLRKSDRKLESRLEDLAAVRRGNEALVEQVHCPEFGVVVT